jgi:hypothetical protein
VMFADVIPPKRVLEILRSEFGAKPVSQQADPLGDWADIRLAIEGEELELIAEHWGTWLRAPDDPESRFLERFWPRLAEALQSEV